MGAILANLIPISIPVIVVTQSLGNPAILSSVGARLFLNMRVAGAKGLNEGMGSNMSTRKANISGIVFADPPSQPSAVSCSGDITGELGCTGEFTEV